MNEDDLLEKRKLLHNFLDEHNIDIGYEVFSGEIIIHEKGVFELGLDVNFRDDDYYNGGNKYWIS